MSCFSKSLHLRSNRSSHDYLSNDRGFISRPLSSRFRWFTATGESSRASFFRRKVLNGARNFSEVKPNLRKRKSEKTMGVRFRDRYLCKVDFRPFSSRSFVSRIFKSFSTPLHLPFSSIFTRRDDGVRWWSSTTSRRGKEDRENTCEARASAKSVERSVGRFLKRIPLIWSAV